MNQTKTKVRLKLVLLFLILATIFGTIFLKRNSRLKSTSSLGMQILTVPIVYFEAKTPVVFLEIEKKEIPVTIDLGFRGHLGLYPPQLQSIENKTYIKEYITYNFKGTKFTKKLYEIPKTKLGNLNFFGLKLVEKPSKQREESVLYSLDEHKEKSVSGALGWPLFEKTNLLLDCKKNVIGFFNNIENLPENGYPVKKCAIADLYTDRGLLEVDILTEQGLLRFALDTGSTYNIINGPLEEGYTVANWVKEDKHHISFKKFEIAGKSFLEQTFCTIPIKLPIHVQAVLGMQFFEDNVVALDFKNKKAYFLPNEELP